MTEEAEQEPTLFERLIAALLELGPVIDEALGREDNDSGDVANLEQIRVVLTFLGKRFDGADEQLLVDSFLDSVLSEVSNATGAVKKYAAEGDAEDLGAAKQAMMNSLAEVARLVFPSSPNELEGLRAAARTYRSSLLRQAKGYERQLEVIEQKAKSLGQKLTTLGTEVRAEEAQLKDSLAAVQRNLADQEAALKASVEASLGDVRERLEAFGAEQAKAHAEAIDAFGQERDKLVEGSAAAFDASLKAWGKAIDTTEAKSSESIEKLVGGFEERGKTMLTEMEAQLQKASELVGIIGDRAVTSGHKKAADEARGRVILWQWVAVISMLCLVTFASLSAFGMVVVARDAAGQPVFTWPALANRVFVSVTIGVLAAYAASQANRYQKVERRNRKLELELKALEPFLESVSPEKKEEFRLKMAEAFFGREEEAHADPSPATFVDVLRSKELIETLGDGVKAIVAKVKS